MVSFYTILQTCSVVLFIGRDKTLWDMGWDQDKGVLVVTTFIFMEWQLF